MEPLFSDRSPTLRKMAQRIQRRVELRHAPAALWPYVSNSDMLNQRAGLGPLRISIAPRATGAPLLIPTAVVGPMELTYLERPHTFLAPYGLDVDRPFLSGPIAYLGLTMELASRPSGGSSLLIELRWVDTSDAASNKVFVEDLASKYAAEIERIDGVLLTDEAGPGFAPFLADKASKAAEIASLTASLARLTRNERAAAALAEFVLLAPDTYVQRIRPFEIASFFGVPHLDVLDLCLRAVRDGLLDMSWDVLCPSCRESSPGPTHLVDLQTTGHCDLCDVDYGAGFDENVEVRFFPVRKIRPFELAYFCAGAPAAKPHIVAQVLVEANSTRSFVLDLQPGEYDKRDELTGFGGAVRVKVEPSGASTYHFRLGDKPSSSELLRLAPGATLSVENPSDAFATLRFETLAHRLGATTAALVTSLQVFRDFFSSEVLRPGTQLGISNVTVLFSDLKDSTVLYERRGDAPAFALVQDHFAIMTDVIRRHFGGIVKTIGDAVMAVFQSAGSAVAASLEVLDAFQEWNATHPPEQQIIIKLGLHRGPCLALNLNDKLDYFGQTVNKAARIQGQSVGADLVLSRELFEDPEVQAALLAEGAYTTKAFVAELKGIAGQTELVRVMRREA